MKHAVEKWSLILGALFIVGPLAWLLTGTLHGPDGGHTTSPLLSNSPVAGLLRALVGLGLAAAVGWVVARRVTVGWGLFCTGMVLAWAAWGTGTVDGVLRVSPEKSTLWSLAVEGLVLAIPAVAIGWWITRSHTDHESSAFADRYDRPVNPVALNGGAVVVSLLGGLLGAWLVAQNTLKGQTVLAAAVGAAFAGMAASSAGSFSLSRPHPAALVAGIVLLAVAGPALGAMLGPNGTSLVMAANGGSLFAPARVMPLDWIAGAFLGVPVGLSLLGSLVEPPAHHPHRGS